MLRFLLLLQLVFIASGLLNPVKKPILNGNKPIHTRFFAKIPDYQGKPSKIVSITSQANDLYVCTSTSGGLIYKVNYSRKVQLWMDVAKAMMISKGRIMDTSNKQHGGLRSLAFHPQFWENGFFYTSVLEQKPKQGILNYMVNEQSTKAADSVVIEWKFDLKQKKILMDSYRQVIRIANPEYDHPIRGLAFEGPNLLIAHGDGSIKSDTARGGQKNDGLGKILRINPLQQGPLPYTIPAGNPFIGNPNYRNEVYAVGFRNPITVCASKRGSVGLVVVDVGRDNVDEVNFVKPGGNYGWAKREGTFFQKQLGGLISGVGPLPADDAKFGYIYPVAQVGHKASQYGLKFTGNALVGSCPIENGSPMSNHVLYSDFPASGDLYYSNIDEMLKAKTTGPPGQLTQANTYKATIYFDHDENPNTPPKILGSLRDVIRMDPGRMFEPRADVRFGRGALGEMYWSSKRNGKIYLITSTMPSAKV